MSQFAVRVRQFTMGGLACLLALMAHTASAQGMRHLKFNEMVTNADTIVVGECVKKEALVSNGQIITRYTLSPSDFLKGVAPLNEEGQVIVEELGGKLGGGFPLASKVSHMADIPEGEEVLLFTKRTPAGQKQAVVSQGKRTFSPEALRIIGLNQGFYHIFKDPESGQKLVSRADSARIQAAISRETKRAMNKMADPNAEDPDLQQKLKAQQETHALRAAESRTMKGIRELAAQSKNYRDKVAEEQPELADEIYQFEPLSEVKTRIAGSLKTK